jgi:hypothetical protein
MKVHPGVLAATQMREGKNRDKYGFLVSYMDAKVPEVRIMTLSL